MATKTDRLNAKAPRFQVTCRAEETDCGWCGAPIYYGDFIYQGLDDEYDAYCSRSCRDTSDRHRVTQPKGSQS